MLKHRSELLAVALVMAAPLSACIVVGASDPPRAPIKAAVRAPRVAVERPQVGTASEQEAFESTGRVQVAFQGLGADGSRRSIGAPVSRVLSLGNPTPSAAWELFQASQAVAKLEVELTGNAGFVRKKFLGPEQLQQPLLALIFVGVPVGPGELQATAYDANGAILSSGSQNFTVEGNRLTEVSLGMRSSSPGAVGAAISLGDAKVREANISGYWVVNAGDTPPEFPMVGCGDDYVWSVTQIGNNIKASVSGWNAPDAPQFPDKYWVEEAFGTIRNNAISLSGIVTYRDSPDGAPVGVERAEYQLAYDPVRMQLTGARNDVRGWAVPYVSTCSQVAAPSTPPPPAVATPDPVAAPTAPPTPLPVLASQGYPVPTRPRTTRVRGTVFGPDDQPVGSGTLTVTPLTPAGDSARVSVAIQPDGSYEADVPAGTWVEMYSESGTLTGSFWGIFYAFSDNRAQDRDLWLTGTVEEAEPSDAPIEPALEASQAFTPVSVAHAAGGRQARVP